MSKYKDCKVEYIYGDCHNGASVAKKLEEAFRSVDVVEVLKYGDNEYMVIYRDFNSEAEKALGL